MGVVQVVALLITLILKSYIIKRGIKNMKSAISKIVLTSLLLVSVGFATPAVSQQYIGTKFSLIATGVGAAPCGSNPSDICINNYSNQIVSFRVVFTPYLQPTGSLNPYPNYPDTVDIWESPVVYNSIYDVQINNNNYNWVPNGSIFNVYNDTTAGGKNQLTVTVTH